MTNFFINQYHAARPGAHKPSTYPEQLDLGAHISHCLLQLPPGKLSLCLRDAIFIHWESLQETTPDFHQVLTEILVLLTRLDHQEAPIPQKGGNAPAS